MSEARGEVPYVMEIVEIVANSLTVRVLSGEFSPSLRLPDPWTLADDYGVWFDTMRHVIGLLQERGVVVRTPSTAVIVGRVPAVFENFHDQRRRLERAIDREIFPLFKGRDLGDEQAEARLLRIGALLVEIGLSLAGEGGADVAAIERRFLPVWRDADTGHA